MNITFETTKECACYQELINNEVDRNAIKNFTRCFNQTILKAVLKTHKKLKSSESAHVYNNMVAIDNKIEILSGRKNKEPLILKVRIQDAYRKFFYFIICSAENSKKCLTEEWAGQFGDVKDIHVFQINKHDYKSVK